MPHAEPASIRWASLDQLDATIARAEGRLVWRHLILGLRAAAGLDTRRAEAKARRARDRLTALREQRSLSLVCRRAGARGYA
jgi:hypothetical protein